MGHHWFIGYTCGRGPNNQPEQLKMAKIIPGSIFFLAGKKTNHRPYSKATNTTKTTWGAWGDPVCFYTWCTALILYIALSRFFLSSPHLSDKTAPCRRPLPPPAPTPSPPPPPPLLELSVLVLARLFPRRRKKEKEERTERRTERSGR